MSLLSLRTNNHVVNLLIRKIERSEDLIILLIKKKKKKKEVVEEEEEDR